MAGGGRCQAETSLRGWGRSLASEEPPRVQRCRAACREVAGRSVGTPAQTCLSEDIQLAEKITPKSLGVAKSVLC